MVNPQQARSKFRADIDKYLHEIGQQRISQSEQAEIEASKQEKAAKQGSIVRESTAPQVQPVGEKTRQSGPFFGGITGLFKRLNQRTPDSELTKPRIAPNVRAEKALQEAQAALDEEFGTKLVQGAKKQEAKEEAERQKAAAKLKEQKRKAIGAEEGGIDKIVGAETKALPRTIKDRLSERETKVLKTVQPEKPAKPPNLQKVQDRLNARKLAQLTNIQRIGRNASKLGQRANRASLSWPQFPGGIALPLVLLIILVFVLIPVNGYTRIQWFWKVITGTAVVVPTYTGESAQTVPGQGFANIGGEPPRSTAMALPEFSGSASQTYWSNYELDEY